MPDPVQFDVLPVLDTSAYADGDVLFAPVEIPGVTLWPLTPALLQSIQVIDESDQGAAFDLLFFRTTVTLGTLNAAPSISDADAREFQGRISVLSSDYYDLGGVRVANLNSLGLLMKTADAKKSFFVGGISRGAGTYAASGLRLRLGFLR